jgi:hypothetical protein
MDRTRLRALLAARYAWLIVCAGRSAVVLAVGAQLMAPGPRPAMAQEVNGISGVGFASYFWRRSAVHFSCALSGLLNAAIVCSGFLARMCENASIKQLKRLIIGPGSNKRAATGSRHSV